ncbi:MAG: hypothetical protein ACYC8T_37530 [Myxococcaceae bacterium]
MEHLDGKTLSALLARDEGALSHFRAHLSSPCEACEEFLLTERRLDGAVDALLLGLAAHPGAPLDEVGYARLKRSMRRGSSAAGLAIAGMAAGVVLALSVGGLAGGPGAADPAGLKGGPRIQLELQAALRSADGRLSRIDDGASVPSDGVLLLRYHATEAGAGELLVQRGAGVPVPLGSFALQSGTHDLGLGGEVQGYSLAGEDGELTLLLTAKPGGSAPGAMGRLRLRVEARPR